MRCAATWSRLLVIGSARRVASLRPPERLPRGEQPDDEGRAGGERREVRGRTVDRERGPRRTGQSAGDRCAHAVAAEPEREQEDDAEEQPAGRGNEPADDRTGEEGDRPPRRAHAERCHATRRPAAYTSRTSGAPSR